VHQKPYRCARSARRWSVGKCHRASSRYEIVSSAAEVRQRGLFTVTRGEEPAATIGVATADGVKCERCWHYHPDTGADERYAGTCPRCVESLTLMGAAPRQMRVTEEEVHEAAPAA